MKKHCGHRSTDSAKESSGHSADLKNQEYKDDLEQYFHESSRRKHHPHYFRAKQKIAPLVLGYATGFSNIFANARIRAASTGVFAVSALFSTDGAIFCKFFTLPLLSLETSAL
jgi:hypothetical protein